MLTTMRTHRSRSGFSLAEVLVALVIMGVIGAAFTRLIVAQSRFFTHEYGLRNARQVSRSSMNLLISDLRMVQDSGGVDSVSSDHRTVRVIIPFAYGLVCKTTGTQTVASLLPVDSSAVAMAKYGGYAVRSSSSGRYTYLTPSAPGGADSVQTYGTPTDCSGNGSGQAGIAPLTINGRVGRVVSVTPTSAGVAGAPLFLWQKITYSFAASSAFPGMYGLYRSVRGNSEEIMAPFDTSSKFKFYVPGQDTSQTSPGSAPYPLVRGFDIVLNSLAPQSNPGQSPTKTQMVTAVFFQNRRGF